MSFEEMFAVGGITLLVIIAVWVGIGYVINRLLNRLLNGTRKTREQRLPELSDRWTEGEPGIPDDPTAEIVDDRVWILTDTSIYRVKMGDRKWYPDPAYKDGGWWSGVFTHSCPASEFEWRPFTTKKPSEFGPSYPNPIDVGGFIAIRQAPGTQSYGGNSHSIAMWCRDDKYVIEGFWLQMDYVHEAEWSPLP